MTYNQLLEYCYFYKGEVLCPKEFDKRMKESYGLPKK